MKVVRSGRLVWYAGAPDEAHWYRHWADKVHPEYYESARFAALDRHELGRVLLNTFDRHGRLLEAGCGAGWFVAALQSAGFDVDGIESSRPLVELVNRVQPDLPVRHADAMRLDEPDCSYSSYVSLGVVEHVPEGPGQFIEEAMRLLRPGGRAVFTVPGFGPLRRVKARLGRYQRDAPREPFYQFGFRAAEFGELLADGGFRIDQVGYQGGHRMFVEELPGYKTLTDRRGGERLVRRPLERVIGERDGHMVVVVATKPT